MVFKKKALNSSSSLNLCFHNIFFHASLLYKHYSFMLSLGCPLSLMHTAGLGNQWRLEVIQKEKNNHNRVLSQSRSKNSLKKKTTKEHFCPFQRWKALGNIELEANRGSRHNCLFWLIMKLYRDINHVLTMYEQSIRKRLAQAKYKADAKQRKEAVKFACQLQFSFFLTHEVSFHCNWFKTKLYFLSQVFE